MNGSSIQPERAWQMALDQLRMGMPKASFDTWVRDTRFVSFEDGVFTISTPNAYGREWLANRLTSTLTRLMTGILNQQLVVDFIVVEDYFESKEEDFLDDEEPISDKQPSVLSIQAEYQSIYDEIVQPDQVIVVPGYFMRYIPLLGLELAWLYIGFRQAAYEAGAARQPGKKFGAPSKKVAHFSGMSTRTFWRWVAKPETWKRLRWLVKPVDSEPRWSRGKDGRPHQSSRYYRVTMSPPLTLFDERSLRSWLYRQLAQGKTPVAVIQSALETPVDELIPWPDKVTPDEDITDEPHSVQQVLQAVCGAIPESQKAQFQELADKLAHHLMPPKDLVFLTHYFVSHWLPRLGPGPGWFVTLMRDRGYINQRTGEVRDEILLPEGYAEVARWLGLKRVKTVWEWLRTNEVATFVRETGREIGSWEDAPRRFKVCLGEPMIESDQVRANTSLSAVGIGANDTHSTQNGIDLIGANDTHSSTVNPNLVGASDTHNGASDTHKPGASDIHVGEVDTHKNGASDTPDWRDWHSLNTLALGLNHNKNTPTTTDADGESDSEISASIIGKGVVGIEWNLSDLLLRNRISAKNQELLLEKGLTAQAFVSWLLYAASTSGNGIRDPIAHAVSRLISDPSRGAGGAFDQLSELPAKELAELLAREINGQSPWNQIWRKAMEGAPRSRLRTLADQLGVPVSNPGYW
ncbi:MAG: DnaA N-terminal domain-containing protein [Anaerolineales bacterium]|nr:DnaA N-terminal domain-containing protein [Anaerolineales bacterium]